MGWKLQAGSITAVWSSPSTIDHYLFTDATGAEYSLSVNTAGVWTSKEGVYMSYDSNLGANKLHFNDGSYWVMGSQSSNGEQDAGTLYPTVIEDTNGNQIVIAYQAGAGSGAVNTSARISTINDPRTAYGPTYTFTYNTDAIPHLTSIHGSAVFQNEQWQFGYNTVTLTDPFAGASYGATTMLASVTAVPTGYVPPSFFSYNTSGEMTQYTSAMGGTLSWTYQPFTYSASVKVREVNSRSMNDAAANNFTNSWTFSHPSGDSSLTYHSSTTILDNGAESQKVAL